MDLTPIERPLRQLRKQLKAVDRNFAPEDVHKLRMRAHRVLAIATIGPEPPRHLLPSVEAIRKAAGKVRDLDVIRDHALTLAGQSSATSLSRLLRRIGKLRTRAAARLDKTLHRHGGRLRRDLADYARQLAAAFPSPRATAAPAASHRQGMMKLRRAVAQLRREIAQRPEPGEANLHDLRIRLKRLRVLGRLLPDQDQARFASFSTVIAQIGEWHDWRHLATIAHKMLHTIRHAPLLAQIDAAAAPRLARAIAAARSLRTRPLAVSALPGAKIHPRHNHPAA